MEISKEELLKRVSSKKNVLSRLVPSGANAPAEKPSDKQSPSDAAASEESLKEDSDKEDKRDAKKVLAAILAGQGIPSSTVAAELNLTPSQVNRAKNSNNPDIAKARDAALSRIQDLAIDKLMCALGLMTLDKFDNCSVVDLSKICSNVSRTLNNLTPKDQSNNQTNIIIYSPEQRKESSFKVIDIGEIKQ